MADLNHDDKLDAAVANYGNSSVSALLGAGDGTFGAKTRYWMGPPSDLTDLGFVESVVVADFDRDGHSDIATPGYRRASVRRGRGDGTFLRLHRLNLGNNVEATGGGAAVADFNRDRWPDLALSESCDYLEFPDCRPHSALVFLNRTAQPARP